MALRVWCVVNMAGTRHYSVGSPEEGARRINEIAAAQLRNPVVWMNVFGMETDEDGTWGEWYDDDGEDVLALADRLLPETKEAAHGG